MMQVDILYQAGKKKFRELAREKTFDEFVNFLKSQPNFKVIQLMDYQEQKELYRLSKEEDDQW